MTDFRDWGTLIAVVILATLAMQIISPLIQRYLKLDKTEREQVLQSQIDQMNDKQDEYESEAATLRGHIKLLLKQYDELVVDYNKLKEDYAKAQIEIADLKKQMNDLRQQTQQPIVEAAVSAQRTLVVFTATDDPNFSLDIASLRAVRTDTGMEVSQIKDITPEGLKRMMDRLRAKGAPFYLHLAIRTDKDGFQIGDKIVDANWLSSVLDGVVVLVVAGSDSDSIGDFLGVVPYVITLAGDVQHRDVALFSRLFWIEIGRGIGPSLALKRASDRSPSSIREAVQSHWDIV